VEEVVSREKGGANAREIMKTDYTPSVLACGFD